MNTGLRRGTTLVVIAGGLVGACALSQAQDPPGQDPGQAKDAATARVERVQGAILAIEPIRQDDTAPSKDAPASRSGPGHVLISINTAAVWRDYVRDQVTAPTKAQDPTTTKQGTNSVATKGEPASPQTVVRVTATPETRVVARFRSATDEVTEGAPTPAGAAAVDPAADRKSEDRARTGERTKRSAKGATRKGQPRLGLQDLQPGQWVDVEATDAGEIDTARRITILKPIGGPDTPAAEARPD